MITCLQFKSVVLHGSHIAVDACSAKTEAGRSGNVEDQVIRFPSEIFGGNGDRVIEQAQVESEVQLFGRFPMDGGVTQLIVEGSRTCSQDVSERIERLVSLDA